MGDDDEEISLGELDHLVGEEETEISSFVKKKRKKYKNTTMSNRGIYLVMLMSFILIVAYYVQNYILGLQLLQKIDNMLPEY